MRLNTHVVPNLVTSIIKGNNSEFYILRPNKSKLKPPIDAIEKPKNRLFLTPFLANMIPITAFAVISEIADATALMYTCSKVFTKKFSK